MASSSKLMQLILIATTAHMSYRNRLWIVDWIKLALSLTFQCNCRCGFPASVSKYFFRVTFHCCFLDFSGASLLFHLFSCLLLSSNIGHRDKKGHALNGNLPPKFLRATFQHLFFLNVHCLYVKRWQRWKDNIKTYFKGYFYRDLTPRSPVKVNPIFGRTYCLHLKGWRVSQTWNEQQRCRIKRI